MNPILLTGGAMLAMSKLRRKRRRYTLPSFKGIMETVHYLPGRVRFQIPVIKDDKVLAASLKKQLTSIKAVRQVEVNSVIGTIRVVYDSEAVAPIILMGAIMKLLGLDQKLNEPRSGSLRDQFNAGIKVTNDALIDATNGLLDFDSLLAALLLGSAVYSIRGNLANLTSPPALTLAWWGFNRMMGMRAE